MGNKVLNQRLVKIRIKQARSQTINTLGAAVSSGGCIYTYNVNIYIYISYMYKRKKSLCQDHKTDKLITLKCPT